MFMLVKYKVSSSLGNQASLGLCKIFGHLASFHFPSFCVHKQELAHVNWIRPHFPKEAYCGL